jgi:hypothetical protein
MGSSPQKIFCANFYVRGLGLPPGSSWRPTFRLGARLVAGFGESALKPPFCLDRGETFNC